MLDKKKYKRVEVEEIISNLKAEHNSILLDLKDQINQLSLENQKLKAEITGFTENEKKISSAIKDAEEFSCSLKAKAEKKYLAEIECLKVFIERWRSYFETLKEKYPLYGKVTEANKVFTEIQNVVSNYSGFDAVEKINTSLDNNKVLESSYVFNPKEKINDYISATCDNGFDMNAVLNPGELELEELCKELGLIDEE